MSSDGFPLVVYAVSVKEHRSEGMVGLARGAVMKRQKTIVIPSLPSVPKLLIGVGTTVLAKDWIKIMNKYILLQAVQKE